MKLIVIGHKGMLGSDMLIASQAAGHDVSGIDFPEIDITHIETIREMVKPGRFDAVINCAAFAAVDLCEKEVERAFAVNALGAGNLARVAKESGSVFVHYSTDYVFDGKGTRPYVETDETNPASVYGKSKIEGERLVLSANDRSFIFRIAWLYGYYGSNFVKTIRGAAEKNLQTGIPLRVVNDQHGSPTWTVDVCRQTLCMLETTSYGLYHATSEGACTWFDFTVEILRQNGISLSVLPCTRAEFPRPAPRPLYSILENMGLKRLGVNLMPHWKEAFSAYIKQERLRRR
jgi:dTDP-4-dehydrorhamnose reductase